MHIIVAPHPDDEIIGCLEIIQKKEPTIIIYGAETIASRRDEAKEVKELFGNIVGQLFLQNLPPNVINKSNMFYFPDPIYETHPLHRFYGMYGESLARAGHDVTFYTTNMVAPYIHEVKFPDDKENFLNMCYPGQKSLWEYEKKYILFEGYCKWIF